MKVAHRWIENRQRRPDVHLQGEHMDSETFINDYI